MKYRIVDLPKGQTSAREAALGALETSGGTWTRFGRTVLVRAANARWQGVEDGLRAAGRERDVGAGEAERGTLRLVTQKGRTFQLDHPDVPVILDKGRFLVVELPAAAARRIVDRPEPCYRVRPLPENAAVFDELAPPARQETPSPAAAAAAAAVSQPAFEAALARLTAIPSRFSTGPGYVEAVEWMRGELAALGLEVRDEPVAVNGGISRNLYALRPGRGTDRRHVLVTAHLDSVNHDGGPQAAAPGADDNASGSAGVLALARALAGATLTHDVTFVLFGGEEQGLLGSKQYVARLSEAERRRIRAVLNMDMIGSLNRRPASVLLESAPLGQAEIDALAAAAAHLTSLVVQVSLDPFASDHVPFIEAGVPAVLTIEGADGANDAVHTDRDTLDRIDPAYAVEILRMNAGYLAVAAGAVADTAPQPSVPPTPQPCRPPPVRLPSEVAAVPEARAEAAAMRTLSAHYQALFAQYARLRREGTLPVADLASWHAAWLVYDRLVAGPEGPRQGARGTNNG